MIWIKKSLSFRPLPRLIGIYAVIGNIYENPELLEFPAPFEGDREIYGNMKLEYGSKSQAFPAPREVDR